jgi:hypothetical protein
MKTALAWILYYLGDLVSRLLVWDLFSFLYPVYNKLMIWSSDLDTEHRIWKEENES